MTWLDALKVGVAQCFALIPGTSRSGATIIGGMLFGLSRPAATEFSFFLAVPTLVAAGAYDSVEEPRACSPRTTCGMFAVGLAASFVSAFVVIRWLIRYVATHDFRPFAWYRIAFGVVVLATAYVGWVRLDALRCAHQLCIQGSPALRQPPTVLRCCAASLSPSKPSSTL